MQNWHHLMFKFKQIYSFYEIDTQSNLYNPDGKEKSAHTHMTPKQTRNRKIK